MTAPVTLSPAAVLRATADWFEADPTRWGREYYYNPKTGCRCALGGISWAVDPDGEDDPYYSSNLPLTFAAISALEGYLLDVLGFPSITDGGPLVGEWNDAPGRTVAEVIDTLRAAADWAEARS